MKTLKQFLSEDQNQTQTTVNSTGTSMEAGDAAYRWLKTNQPQVHDYLINHAPVPIDPVMTIKAIKQMGPNRTMEMIKSQLKVDAKKMYGPDYPLSESILSEGLDIDYTWKRHGDDISQKLFDEDIFDDHKETFAHHLNQGDPTAHKEYAPWLASRYAKGGIEKLEDFSRANHALGRFDNAKRRKQLGKFGINADINQYKTLPDLEDAVLKLPQEEVKQVESSDKNRTIHDEEHWKIIIPHTEEASCRAGAGSAWCTAATQSRNLFKSYHGRGPLVIMIPKNPVPNSDKREEKYQLHLVPGMEFRDSSDRRADLKQILKDRPSKFIQDQLDNNLHLHSPESLSKMIPDWDESKHSKLVGHGSKVVQQALIEHGSPRIKDAVYSHPAFDPELKSHLIKNDERFADKFWNTALEFDHKRAYIERGYKPAFDRFMNDDNHLVRALVAAHGTNEHRKKLLNDPSFIVKHTAQEYMK